MRLVILISLLLLPTCKQRSDLSGAKQDVYSSFGRQMTPMERLADEEKLLQDLQKVNDLVHVSLYKSLSNRAFDDRNGQCGHEAPLADEVMEEILKLIYEENVVDTAVEGATDKIDYRSSPRFRMREELQLTFDDIKGFRRAFENLYAPTIWGAITESWTNNKWVMKSMWFLTAFRAMAHTAYIRMRLEDPNVKPWRIHNLFFWDPDKFYTMTEQGLVIKSDISNQTRIRDEDIRYSMPSKWFDVDGPKTGRDHIFAIGEMGLVSSTPSFLDSPHFGKWFSCPKERWSTFLKDLTDVQLPENGKVNKEVTYILSANRAGVTTGTSTIQADRLPCGRPLSDNLKMALEVADYLEANWRSIFYGMDDYQLTAQEKGWALPPYSKAGWVCATEIGQSRIFTKKILKGFIQAEMIETSKRIEGLRAEVTQGAGLKLTNDDWQRVMPQLKCPTSTSKTYIEAYRGNLGDWPVNDPARLSLAGEEGLLYLVRKRDLLDSEILGLTKPENTADQNKTAVFNKSISSLQGRLAPARYNTKNDQLGFSYYEIVSPGKGRGPYLALIDTKDILLICKAE